MGRIIVFLLVVCVALSLVPDLAPLTDSSDGLLAWFSEMVEVMAPIVIIIAVIMAGFYLIIRSLFR